MIGVVIFLVIALAIFAYVYYQRNLATRHIFIMSYNLVYDRTGSVSRALREAIEVFRYRPPFDNLDDESVDHLVAVFSKHSDPLTLSNIFHQMDSRQDGRLLNNHQWVIKVAGATEKAR